MWPQLQQLACFQRLVELTESTRILMDLGQPQPNHQYSELKAGPLVSHTNFAAALSSSYTTESTNCARCMEALRYL